jgi:hypothetical protein
MLVSMWAPPTHPFNLQPPWLVLMRDHFAVCLAAAIVFSSLLCAVMAFFISAVRQQRS